MNQRSGFAWHGFFGSTLYGFQEEAVHFVRALERAEIPVRPMRMVLKETRPRADERRFSVFLEDARWLSKSRLEPNPYVAVWHTLPRFIYSDLRAEANVVRTMFETDRLPPDAVDRYRAMDEVWVPSEFNMQTFADAGVPTHKLFKVPETIDLDLFHPNGPRLELDRKHRFIFFSCFNWCLRKGWDLLLDAYLEEFSPTEPVLLLIKTWGGHRPELRLGDRHAAVGFIEGFRSAADMAELYRSAHCFVLPSRGEGWGRPYMEAMATGLPVIGTGWGGNLEFMNRDNSYLLEAPLAPVSNAAAKETPAYAGGRWADPDKYELRAMMREVFTRYDRARKLGQRARVDLERRFSYDRLAGILGARLSHLVH